ncbi:MAG: N-acetylmuramoyl-L-alanine amidase [Gemmatimonadetes bacterium]|nr:N-acetylmuramoyl-L-alanine amidase [Gemmatimonadota bacterium]
MMLALLFAAAIAGPVDSLRFVISGRDSAIPVRADGQASFVMAEAAAGALGGRVQRLPNHRFLVSIAGVAFELADRVPFALSDGRLYPLVVAARERDGRLELPVQLFTDVAPRAGARLRWDPVRQRLTPTTPPPAVASRPSAPVVRPAAESAAPPPRPAASRVVRNADSAPPAPAVRPARRRVVVVDAGHGGRDPGMRGWSPERTAVREKDVTLGVALQLEQELERRGYAVVMTRRTDTLITLDDRGRIANRSKGDLFISVHVNAANPKWREPHAARGFETYFLAEAKTEDERRVAQMENEVVRFETEADAPANDPLGFIINDMAQNEHLRESNDLAEIIQGALRRVHPGPSRGVKQAGFRVLVKAYMPAVLVEIGFGTNSSEAAFMSSPSGQRTLATAIADAAAEYLGRYEQRITPGGGR